MKTKTQWFSLVALFAILLVVFANSLAAQTSGSGGGGDSPTPVASVYSVLPDEVPLLSIETLKAYALTLVDQIDGQLYAPSISGSSWFSVPYPYRDADPDHMASVASAQRINPSVDPYDQLQASMSYDGAIASNRFQLFYCSTNFFLELGKGDVWQVPAYAYTNRLELGDRIPFSIPNLQDASIVLKDQRGYTVGYYNFQDDYRIWRDQGIIFFGREHLGQTGSLYITLKDGTKAVYGLPDGAERPTTEVAYGFQPSIEGIRSLPNNSSVVVFQKDDRLVRASYDQDVVVSVIIPDGLKQYPTSVFEIDTSVLARDPAASWNTFNPWNGSVSFNVTAGQVIFIRYEYSPSPQPLGLSGGGKG